MDHRKESTSNEKSQESTLVESFLPYHYDELSKASETLSQKLNYNLKKRLGLTASMKENTNLTKNVWEGVDGTMSHVTKKFPMPAVETEGESTSSGSPEDPQAATSNGLNATEDDAGTSSSVVNAHDNPIIVSDSDEEVLELSEDSDCQIVTTPSDTSLKPVTFTSSKSDQEKECSPSEVLKRNGNDTVPQTICIIESPLSTGK